MNERRLESAGSRPDSPLATDLQALGRETAHDLTPLDTFVRPATRRPRTWEEYLMTPFQIVQRRPWMSAGFAGALIAVALLVVPLSYERTTGQTVQLTLSGNTLDQSRAGGIALQMKKLLHAGGVSLQVNDDGGGTTYTLASTVPNSAGINAAAAANAFCAELGRLGYSASAKVTPVKERVSGSVYAYARDRVIEVSIDGKSAAEIEAEIKQGLADAGVPDAQVSVTRNDASGKQELKLTVDAQKIVTDPNTADAPESMPRLMLKHDGAALEGQGFMVREELRRSPGEGTTLILHVQDGTKTADISVAHSDTIGDAAIGAQVESQLRSAGITARVTVANGRVHIENNK